MRHEIRLDLMAVLAWIAIVPANVSAKAQAMNEPFCYIQGRGGMVIDLTNSHCGGQAATSGTQTSAQAERNRELRETAPGTFAESYCAARLEGMSHGMAIGAGLESIEGDMLNEDNAAAFDDRMTKSMVERAAELCPEVMAQ